MHYDGFCRLTLGKKTTSLVMIDDCGNKWNCISIYGPRPYKHIKIGGAWKRMAEARRLPLAATIKVGAANVGKNETIYFDVKRPSCF